LSQPERRLQIKLPRGETKQDKQEVELRLKNSPRGDVSQALNFGKISIKSDTKLMLENAAGSPDSKGFMDER
jgi:hypothetical protein